MEQHTSKQLYDEDYFNGRQKRGVLTLSNAALLRLIAKRMNRHEARTATALEIGCAFGAFTNELSHIFDRVTGVDISSHAIKTGHERFPGLDLRIQDIDNAPLPDSMTAAYDAIISLHTFEHFSHPKAALEKTYKALSNGGLFFLVVPNPQIWIGKLLKLVGEQDRIPVFGDKTHVSLFSQKKWIELLRSSGFHVSSFGRPFYVIKHPFLDRIYRDRYYTRTLQRSGFELLFICQKP